VKLMDYHLTVHVVLFYSVMFSPLIRVRCSSSFFTNDKITNMVFDQIDKQLELVNISMNSTSQTTNQINSDCYKEMTFECFL
jgi:hypothetical protein